LVVDSPSYLFALPQLAQPANQLDEAPWPVSDS
jgi:hypothetical protein